MFKKIFLLSILLAACSYAAAQKPAQVLDAFVAKLRAGGTITANFNVTAANQSLAGTLAMSNKKFRLISDDTKCWYDGATQWTYSTATGEVNITTPTAEDLQMTNPLAAAESFKTKFNMKRAKAKTPKTYVIKCTPKQKGEIATAWLYFDETTGLLRTARFDLSDGNIYKVKITNYKMRQSLPASTFSFDKSQVPAGVPVVDLR